MRYLIKLRKAVCWPTDPQMKDYIQETIQQGYICHFTSNTLSRSYKRNRTVTRTSDSVKYPHIPLSLLTAMICQACYLNSLETSSNSTQLCFFFFWEKQNRTITWMNELHQWPGKCLNPCQLGALLSSSGINQALKSLRLTPCPGITLLRTMSLTSSYILFVLLII